jgi:hypothetical protein
MLRKFLLFGAVAALALSCFGQTTTQSSNASAAANPALPDSTYFRFFFIHVARLQTAADALKAQGKADGQMRYLIRSKAHLTSQEDALLRGVALNCNVAYAAASKSGVAATKELVQPFPNASAVPSEVLQQISNLEAQRAQVITGCMANLQSQMRPARYQMLRSFVIASEGPNIKQAAAPPPGGPQPR